ncbi:MAG: TMAO reductase system periplasmic protein TorT [Rhodospirillum sp.]|nr:TMAO reductase system periplasmic protein TorT [Rhodospirillum sp.]MCF8488943.1 TMAO reductase system periplasmic protein TorT [Rhodospirillum sp.]MCF8498999.1 TMAO reductase system periplasmic protein TorT [Rhodospirillum sp.]
MIKISIICGAALVCLAGSASAGETWTVDQWSPSYDFSNNPKETTYSSMEKASKDWNLCVVFPHLKDPYWVATNFGVVDQARKLGVRADIFESGGYPNLDKQIEQVKHCAAAGTYDAILLGTVSYDLMTPTVVEAAKSIPVFATVNQIQGDGLSGMVAVNWVDMGRAAGRYFVEQHPAGSTPAKVAWIPGPETAGWVKFTDKGFREVIKDAAVDLVTVKYGDTGNDIQKTLVEDTLDEFPDVEYIAGNAVAIEAAMAIVRQRGLTGKVKLVADYFTPAIYRGVRRGVIVSAPTDSAALQGVLSVDQAVRFLEGTSTADHIGPVIFNVDTTNVQDFPVAESLAPSEFTPVFSVP